MSSASNWQDMFGGSHRDPLGGMPPPIEREEDEPPVIDPTDYRPWHVQRVRSRPSMMLHLRRFEQRSDMWVGWALSYPSLLAVEYTGDQFVTLDFGSRHFVVEGIGLGALVAQLQSGSVLSLQEYSQVIWPMKPAGSIIRSIKRVTGQEGMPQR
ncbi:MAG: hypothetical protein V4808_12490 [Pseudomonadota bacterium]